jgi:hypothetical protein
MTKVRIALKHNCNVLQDNELGTRVGEEVSLGYLDSLPISIVSIL